MAEQMAAQTAGANENSLMLVLYSFAFAVLYHYLPDRRVRWRQALFGGVVTSVLFALGSQDQMTPPKAAQTLSRRAKHGQTVLLRAGHSLMTEDPDGVLTALQFDRSESERILVEIDGDKVSAVSGTLTLLGKTQPVSFKANQFNCYQSPMLKREVCGGDFEATIDRAAFGVNYGIDWGFPKNVRIVLQVEAVKQ